MEALDMTIVELFPNTSHESDSQPEQTQCKKLDLVALAQEKQLPWKYLFHLGVTEKREGCLQIPYHLQDGTLAHRHRLRTALVAKEGSHWSKGQGEIVPYGLERLEEGRSAGYLVLVEGESDCWTLWLHGFPALGLPGAEMVRTLKDSYLAGIDKLYIVRESDEAGARFVTHLKLLLDKWKWQGKTLVVSLVDAKDTNELHKRDWKGFKAAFQQALDHAEPLGGAKAPPTPSSSEYIPAPFTLPELLARQLPLIQWTVPDILPEGLTILAGKPKLGKSWLALSVALAVASGGVALGTYPVMQGEVLYLALEDNERRLQSRAKQLLASLSAVPDTIAFELRWPRLDQGGLMYVEEYLQTHPQVRLVVVDTWARVSPKAQHRQRSQYQDDYEALTPLKYLADTYRVSILAIHHLRKMRGDDVLDEITGSIGLTGVVDGALILKRERGQHEATLFVTGRDIEQEQQFALKFDAQTALWTLMGNAEEVKRTKERQEILDLLSEQFPEGMNPRQAAEALQKNYHTTRCLLRKMAEAGEIQHDKNLYSVNTVDGFCHHQRNQRNQRNQSEPSALQPTSQIEYREEPCPPAHDYSHDAHAGVSRNESRVQSIPPPFGGCSLHFPSTTEALFAASECEPYARHHEADSVINRNQRNQSIAAITESGVRGDDLESVISRNHVLFAAIRTEDHDKQSSPHGTDYVDYTDYSDAGDYVDYTDYAHECISTNCTHSHAPDPLISNAALQLAAPPENPRTLKEDMQGTQDDRVDGVINAINRNQRHHCDLQCSQVELHAVNDAPYLNHESAGRARASPYDHDKKRCLHHPHARWVRFDPSGQAWCDKMDCWDCFRLMKIGEALGFRPLSKFTRGIVTVGQGIAAWSSFVTTQGSFAVLTATQYAIDLCKTLELEVPDLSGEVKRLVKAGD
jgi:hypothetical protein